MKASASEMLSAVIAEIRGLERAACLERWQSEFGRSPPKYLSPQFMRRVLIWEAQCQVLGRVPAKTERALKRLAAGKAPTTAARPGSHLVREWNWRTYQVCRYAVTRGTFPLTSQIWEEGDVHEMTILLDGM